MTTHSRATASRLVFVAAAFAICPALVLATPSADDLPPGVYKAARTENPGMAPAVARRLSATTAEADIQLSSSDLAFIEAALRSGLAEVNDSRLAQVRSKDEALRAKAEEIEKGYAASNRSLKRIAALHGLDVPIEPATERRERYSKLQELEGAAFDSEYVPSALALQERHIEMLERAADTTQNAEVLQFVRDTLPVLKANLAQLENAPG